MDKGNEVLSFAVHLVKAIFTNANTGYRAVLFSLTVLWVSCVTPALADDPGLPPPPVSQIIDSNGVNLTTSVWRPVGPGATIGLPGQGGLNYTVNKTETDYWNSTVKNAAGSGHYTVTLLGAPEAFTLSGSTFTPDKATGGSLTFDGTNYTYTNRNGDVAVFPATTFTCGGYCAVGLISTLTYANGESLSFTFRTASNFISLLSINTNLGYQIKVTYKSDNPSSSDWYEIDHVTAINNAVDWCDPTVDGCSGLTQTWPTLTFSTVSGVAHLTDTMGHATLHSYTFVGTVVTQTYQFPAGDKVSITQDQCSTCDPGVFTYTNNNGTWNYSIEASGTDINASVTGLGQSRCVVTDATTGIVKSDTLDCSGAHPLTTLYDNDGVHITKITYPEGNVRQFTYDSRGNTTEVRDISKTPHTPADVFWSATYPSSCTSSNFRICNKPSTVTDPNGKITTYSYDSNSGGVLTITGPTVSGGQAQARNSYTAMSAWYRQSSSSTFIVAPTQVYKPTGTSKCLGNGANWGAANWGNFSWLSSSSCLNTDWEARATTTYPTGSSSVATNLLPSSTTAASGSGTVSSTTSQTYDIYSNVVSQIGPNSSNTTVTFFDLDRRAIGTVGTDPDGAGSLQNPATRTTFDGDNRVTEVETGYAPSQSFSDWQTYFTSVLQRSVAFDGLSGLKTSESAAVGGTTQSITQYTYDGNNNLSCVAVRQDPSYFSSLPTSACNQSKTPPYGSFGADRITQYTYDGANRLLATTIGYNTSGVTAITEATNTYTYNSKLATVEDAKGYQTSYSYDGLDRQVQVNFPDKTTQHMPSGTDYEQYGYDSDGNQISLRLRTGETIAYSFDAMNRMIEKDIPGGTNVFYSYDLTNNLLSAHFGSSSGAGDDYTYDVLGRKLTETSYGRTVTSQYDATGNRTHLIYPDGVNIQYSYDVLGRMTQAQRVGDASALATYSYDNIGRVTGIGRPNSTSTSRSYSSTSTGQSLTQTMASSGQNVTFTMAFSPADQMSSRTISNSSYAYSASTASHSYTPNGLNQYTAVDSSYYTYDGRGNLTCVSSGASCSGTVTRSQTYDLENRLTAVSGSPALSVSYDPAGRMQQTSYSATEQYLYDGDSLIVEYDSSGNVVRRYVPGQDVDETLVWYEGSGTSTPNWLHTDQQGSVVATSNASGSATVHTYDPAGNQGTSWGTVPIFRYIGQAALPVSALYYYKARVYDASLGRFLQTDPAGYDGGMNLYAYVGNDPVNRSDPSGLWCSSSDESLGVSSDGTPLVQHNPPLCGPNDPPPGGLHPDAPGGIQIVNSGRDNINQEPGRSFSQLSNGTNGGLQRNGPKPPSHDDDDPDYNRDLNKCRALADAGNWPAANRCYGSAIKRKGLRDKGIPESELPPLIMWRGALAIGGGVGAGYLIYRGIRMIPSLAPPLWWTIPENALIP